MLEVSQMLGIGLPELNQVNLLYQSPNFVDAGNPFKSHVGLIAFPVFWTGVYWNRKQLLSEGYRPLTRTQTPYVILSETLPGSNVSASLKAIWWQKFSQHLKASKYNHACHWLLSFITMQNPSPCSHVFFLLFSTTFSCVSTPQIQLSFSHYSLGSLFFSTFPKTPPLPACFHLPILSCSLFHCSYKGRDTSYFSCSKLLPSDNYHSSLYKHTSIEGYAICL